jgi:hypothetical protein
MSAAEADAPSVLLSDQVRQALGNPPKSTQIFIWAHCKAIAGAGPLSCQWPILDFGVVPFDVTYLYVVRHYTTFNRSDAIFATAWSHVANAPIG